MVVHSHARSFLLGVQAGRQASNHAWLDHHTMNISYNVDIFYSFKLTFSYYLLLLYCGFVIVFAARFNGSGDGGGGGGCDSGDRGCCIYLFIF